ncbi:MAG: hypothetical protein HY558_07940 [Euryarchaeota archaeon]|nr:hypothetical protein [Euryarchaeota archaeon]
MPILGIEFVEFTPELERRISRLAEDIKRKKVPAEDAIDILMHMISGFISTFEGDPQVERFFRSVIGKRVSVNFPGYAVATGTLRPGGEVDLEEGLDPTVPTLTIHDIDTLRDLVLGRLDDVAALRSGAIRIEKMAELLKWIAPFVALQNRKRNTEFKKTLHTILDRTLKKYGY